MPAISLRVNTSQVRVTAIVVTFNPDPARLPKLLARLHAQVSECVVVDNASEADISTFDLGGAELLRLTKNLGVAAAQNQGVRWAKERRADAILLMDQDSIPAPDMVARLVNAWARLARADERVAALGPNYADPRVDHGSPFHRMEGLRLVRPRCDGNHQTACLIPVDHLTASGSLIPMAAWEKVGPMDESLFIDYVDVEWGLRATSRGLRCFGVCDAFMEHALGDRPVRVLRRRVVTHPPLRNYYFFRNGLRLIRADGYSRAWKFAEARRLTLRLGFYILFGKPLPTHLRHIVRGLRDGWLGRTGPR